ncbi:MAG TPA: hypothetical protein VM487_20255 [Phycisphaerae bacterium]|nr:hypothetical protein [Phycisphaerae bacterium]
MKAQIANALKRTAFIVSPVLLWGCAPEASSAATMLQDVQVFIADFGRQALAALLL